MVIERFNVACFMLIAAGLVIAGLNVTIFFVSFNQIVFASPLEQNYGLWASADFQKPSPPEFLSELDLRAADISLGGAEPFSLLRYHPNEVLPLASLTKLFSALVVLEENPDWSYVVTVGEEDWRGGAKPRILPGDKLTVGDLWSLMLISSDNDATAALIRGLKLDEKKFVERLNLFAVDLGLNNTHLVEPTGLSPDNVSTARDFAVIARLAFSKKEITEALSLASEEVTINDQKRLIYSSDQSFKLFKDWRVDGWAYIAGKTGYVAESGYNVALLGLGSGDEKVLAVILGNPTAENRLAFADRLLKWSFTYIENTIDH